MKPLHPRYRKSHPHPANPPRSIIAADPTPAAASVACNCGLPQIDHGAGGLGDAMQALGVLAGTGRPWHLNVGATAVPFARLFAGVCIGTSPKIHTEDTGTPALQMNRGYDAERKAKIAVPRWERYARNIGADPGRHWALPALRDRAGLGELGRECAGCVALCPWSTGRWAEWSIHAWLDLEARLHDAGYPTVVLSDKPERCEPFRGGKLIGESAEMVVGALLNAVCAVGIDSGLSHLAGILGRPVVVIGGATRVRQIFGCYPGFIGVQGELGCSGCFHNEPANGTCRENCSNIHSVTPERVFREVDAVGLRELTDGRTLVSVDRLAVIRDELLGTANCDGDVAEVGVYRGGVAKLLCRHTDRGRVHLFDTFAGIPETDAEPGGHRAGDFGDTDLAAVKAFVDHPRATFHPGMFPKTGPMGARYRFVHLDADTYQSTAAALEHLEPRMEPGGVLVSDDYGWHKCPGVARALHERFGDRVEASPARFQAIVRF